MPAFVTFGALLIALAQSYKFEPLLAVSPGTYDPASTLTIATAPAARVNPAAFGPWNPTVPTTAANGGATNGGTFSAYPTAPGTGYAAATTVTGADTTLTGMPADAAAGAASFIDLAAGPMLRNGGTLHIVPSGTATQNVLSQGLVGGAGTAADQRAAVLYCVPGVSDEMTAANQLVDCSMNNNANNALTTRTGAMALQNTENTPAFWDCGLATANTDCSPTGPFRATFNTDLLSSTTPPGLSGFNGRYLCYAGDAIVPTSLPATPAAALTQQNVNSCPAGNTNNVFQKVISVGTPTATPTPTPGSSPTGSPISPFSPSASPTSAALCSHASLVLLVAVMLGIANM